MHLKIPVFVIPSYKILHFKNDVAGDDDDDDDGGGTYVHIVRPYHMRLLRGKHKATACYYKALRLLLVIRFC